MSIDIEQYVAGVERGDRAVMGRAISLLESSRPEHEEPAQRLLRRLLPRTGRAVRLGITGVPGAGKSTFIERLGVLLCESGRRVAVIAVDPSSVITGGSILGDRTRMIKLSAHPGAFIRPSPSRATLGGVARRTREVMLLCEAAGYDVVLIETVGVGQSEAAVANMADCFLALAIPNAGDDLQGMKRGLLELVDIIAVNKADGENVQAAKLAARDLAMAAHMAWSMRQETAGEGGQGGAVCVSEVPVLLCSARTGEGVWEVWQRAAALVEAAKLSGALGRRRRVQEIAWLQDLVRERLGAMLDGSRAAAEEMERCRLEVVAGSLAPAEGAERVIGALLDSIRGGRPAAG